MHYKRLRKNGTLNCLTKEQRGAITSAAMTGKTQTEETRRKRSIALTGRVFTPEHRAKISHSLSGVRKSDTARQRMSVAKSGRVGTPLTAEWRLKVSEGHKKVAKRGRAHHCFGKAPRHSKRVWYKGNAFRSTSEVKFAEFLDDVDVAWEYERDRFDLGECTYLPDFYLPEYGSYYEVKGWITEAAEKKFDLFRAKYPSIPLIVVPDIFIRQLKLRIA